MLDLARNVHVFHAQSVYIAKQALHLVILLNELVNPVEGPTDEEHDERNDLDEWVKANWIVYETRNG